MSSNADVWFCFPGCDCQRCGALRSVPALNAENARLRGEVETTQAILDEMMVRHNRISALETDLARVTAERDDLLAAAQRAKAVFLRAYPDGSEEDSAWSDLRAAIAACAPPTSGEEG
jgi:hypothetical protein